jgi:hypothetical protein
MKFRKLTDEAGHFGEAVATASMNKVAPSNWRNQPSSSRREIHGTRTRITGETGKSNAKRHINLGRKQTGKPTAGNLHGEFDAAGGWRQVYGSAREALPEETGSQQIGGNLRGTAPVLDPTDADVYCRDARIHIG